MTKRSNSNLKYHYTINNTGNTVNWTLHLYSVSHSGCQSWDQILLNTLFESYIFIHQNCTMNAICKFYNSICLYLYPVVSAGLATNFYRLQKFPVNQSCTWRTLVAWRLNQNSSRYTRNIHWLLLFYSFIGRWFYRKLLKYQE